MESSAFESKFRVCRTLDEESYLESGWQWAWGVLAGLGAIMTLIVMIIVYLQRNKPVIHYASPVFCELTLFGCLFSFCGVITWIVDPTDASCALQPWMLTLSFCIIMVPLLVKTYRVYRFFNNSTLQLVKITNQQLLVCLGVILAIQIVILIFWMAFSLPEAKDSSTIVDQSYIYRTCRSDHPVVFVSVNAAFFGILILAGMFLAFKTRYASYVFNEARYIACIVFSIAFVCAVVLPVSYLQDDHETTINVIAGAWIGLTYVVLCVLFLPKLVNLNNTETGLSHGRVNSTTRKRAGTSTSSSL